ncbi:hypothetical protein Pla123a_28320 [Posidoniimonas polymericola]|uniref:PEP-CTERM protein-sorting domain-containing protein n=1 Tax=Posidoniimonas polymericola TaxID=2528002 RepID=A0A5C5YMG4_9BACT|nr:PEP-CTERM sorting domain-containing protein [Posidoniimonas polymericola]TWT76046.1 hypothetical protein Pla123a_28320 [Posidoniimonas polymericola]
MLRRLASGAMCAVLLGGAAHAQYGTVLWSEDFEGVTLQDSTNERVGAAISENVATEPGTSPIAGVWSATGPAGWTVDNTVSTYDGAATVTPGVPGTGLADYGVDEWDGWGFASKEFWSAAAGDQDRSQFGTTSGASGTVAIADPDEYFDLGSQNDPVNGGYYSTAMTTPSFPVSGGLPHGVGFDSSWRDEAFDDSALGDTYVDLNNQAVEVIVTYNTGFSESFLKWNSDSADGDFKDDAADENFPGDGSGPAFVAPGDATSATLTFKLANGGNDWWWAVDNIEVNDLGGGQGRVFFEDFEGVTLGDSVNERLAAGANVTTPSTGVTNILGVDYPTQSVPNAYTHDFPAGWSTGNAGTPGAGGGDDAFGVLEWEQWSITDKDFWAEVGGSSRNQFDNASGAVAVADGDEWDDIGNPDADGVDELTTFMRSPAIDVSSEDTITFDFDSSWRPEDSQAASLVAYLDGVAQELFSWSSDSAAADYKPSAVNENLMFVIDTTGVLSVEFEFSYAGSDDWWWAVDNLQVRSGAIPEPSAGLLVLAAINGLGLVSRRKR